jgi:hypothetical protein
MLMAAWSQDSISVVQHSAAHSVKGYSKYSEQGKEVASCSIFSKLNILYNIINITYYIKYNPNAKTLLKENVPFKPLIQNG